MPTARDLWSYKNEELEARDVYQIVRDIDARQTRIEAALATLATGAPDPKALAAAVAGHLTVTAKEA